MTINNKNAYSPVQIDGAYIASLVELVNACKLANVNISAVRFYQNGFHVTFENFKGDAICHDGSYGSPYYANFFNPDKYRNDFNDTGMWETMGFPWDYNDVSTHSAVELAYYLQSLKEGSTPWENVRAAAYEEEEEEEEIDNDVDESNYDPYSGCDVFETNECF